MIRGMITAKAALLFVILGLLSPAPAVLGSRSQACCMSYIGKQIPFRLIKGYREQTMTENCRIRAIIFYTVKKNEICAAPNAAWVKKTLELLSLKLKMMSKAKGGTRMRKDTDPSFDDGSASFFSSTETYANNTGSFY